MNGTLLSHSITQSTPPTWQDKQWAQAVAERLSPSRQSHNNYQGIEQYWETSLFIKEAIN